MVPELHMEYKFNFYTYNGVISESFANLTLINILKHPTSCCNIHVRHMCAKHMPE